MVIAGALAAPACDGDDGGTVTGTPVSVMTRNIYLGTSLTPLASVASPAALPATAAAMWANVQASDFPARAKVLADEITALSPDLVALQEVTLYRRQSPSDALATGGAPNATEVALDFLATLMAEIAARGGSYTVAGEAPNADAELPVDDGAGGLFDLRVTDRDVMLARAGVQTSDFVQTPFDAKLMLPVGGTGGIPVAFTRSASRVQAVVNGASFTFATSHLEVELLAAVQMQQAQEMVDALAPLAGPIVLIGDFNSAPGMSSYPLITGTFSDAYPRVGGSDPGFTCCQADDLMNPESSASERIDLVLLRGAVRVTGMHVVGTDPTRDRTPNGLWPSDHFGVLANLTVP